MPAVDSLPYMSAGSDSPAPHAVIVTYDDANDLASVTRALVYSGAGAVKVTTQGGETLVIPTLPAGTILPIRVTRVWSTSTTVAAGGLLALW